MKLQLIMPLIKLLMTSQVSKVDLHMELVLPLILLIKLLMLVIMVWIFESLQLFKVLQFMGHHLFTQLLFLKLSLPTLHYFCILPCPLHHLLQISSFGELLFTVMLSLVLELFVVLQLDKVKVHLSIHLSSTPMPPIFCIHYKEHTPYS